MSFLMLKTHLFYFLFCYGACQTGARVAGVKASATKNPLPAAADPHHQLHITTTPKYAPLPPNTSKFFVSIFCKFEFSVLPLTSYLEFFFEKIENMKIRIFVCMIYNILLYTKNYIVSSKIILLTLRRSLRHSWRIGLFSALTTQR